MPLMSYWRWHIRVDGHWYETHYHERAITMKAEHPEAMPVLGSQIKYLLPDSAPFAFESLAEDVPF
ncbi:hypothetical protein D3C72_1048700 [compost metagenome]